MKVQCKFCGADVSTTPSKARQFCDRECRTLYRRRISVETERDRFWSKVDRGEYCWLWSGRCNADGYGIFDNLHKIETLAHRWSWILSNGSIPEGLFVLHRCDNPPCVNPDHLFIGTKSDNSRDMADKGRAFAAKIDAKTAKLIREEYAKGNILQRELGRKYGMTQPGISHIICRDSWKD